MELAPLLARSSRPPCSVAIVSGMVPVDSGIAKFWIFIVRIGTHILVQAQEALGKTAIDLNQARQTPVNIAATKKWPKNFQSIQSSPSVSAGAVISIVQPILWPAATVQTVPRIRRNCSDRTGWSGKCPPRQRMTMPVIDDNLPINAVGSHAGTSQTAAHGKYKFNSLGLQLVRLYLQRGPGSAL